MIYRSLTNRMVNSGFLKVAEVDNPLVVILRIISIPIVKLGVGLGIHPNAVTTLSLVLGCLGALFYLIGENTAFIVVWLVSVILDYADGIIARKSGKESRFGYLFDMIGDRAKLFALLFAWALASDSTVAVILAAAAATVVVLSEAFAHIFVQHDKSKSGHQTGLVQMLSNVFFRFDMHTFFIYGLAILLPGVGDDVATVWLLVVLCLHLWRTVAQRVPYNEERLFLINTNYVNMARGILRPFK